MESANLTYLRKGFSEFHKRLPHLVGNKAVAFTKENFRRQGWVYNGVLEKWQPRKNDRSPGRAILVQSGRGARSIRKLNVSQDFVRIGSPLPYMSAHNKGATIRKEVRVRSHVRQAHRRAGRPVGSAQVKSHSRRMNLALPKRQFLGHSPDVIKSVERELARHINQIVKKV